MRKRGPFVCKHCGCNASYWFYGWKHANGGWNPRKTCGRKLTGDNVVIGDRAEADRIRGLAEKEKTNT